MKLEELELTAYFAARPSMLPPSPIVIYVGDVESTFGVHKPFVILYLMFDTGNCVLKSNNVIKTHLTII